jgi:dihydropyrimidinase
VSAIALERPRAGAVAVRDGIVVFDPEKKVTISASEHHSKVDYSLFDGTEVTGTTTPEVVLLRGQVLVENDELVADPGVGQFVPRTRFSKEL